MKTKTHAVKIYEGDVEITESNAAEWKERLQGVVKITGSVYVSGKADFPVLAEVGGSVYVSGKADFPVLAEVGGYVDVSGKADFPVLAEVGGYVDVRSGAEAKFPVLAEVGGYVYVSGKAEMPPREKIGNKPKPVRPIREVFATKGYLLADGILTRIISKRKQGQIIIYKTSRMGNRRKVLYVVQRGQLFAHGETAKKAAHDLRYKLTDRDTTFCEKWKLDSVHPIEDMIQAYRAITGACEAGTKGFCEGKKLPARMSVKVAIRATKGSWGAEKFAGFFKK